MSSNSWSANVWTFVIMWLFYHVPNACICFDGDICDAYVLRHLAKFNTHAHCAPTVKWLRDADAKRFATGINCQFIYKMCEYVCGCVCVELLTIAINYAVLLLNFPFLQNLQHCVVNRKQFEHFVGVGTLCINLDLSMKYECGYKSLFLLHLFIRTIVNFNCCCCSCCTKDNK